MADYLTNDGKVVVSKDSNNSDKQNERLKAYIDKLNSANKEVQKVDE